MVNLLQLIKTLPTLGLSLIIGTGSLVAQEIGDYEPREAWDGNPDINGIWQAIGTAQRACERRPTEW